MGQREQPGNAAGDGRRRDILRYIIEYRDEHGYAPTYREIQDTVGPVSPTGLVRHLRHMMDVDGVITFVPGQARTIVVTGAYEEVSA